MPKFTLRMLMLGISAICVYLAFVVPPAIRNKQAIDTIVHTYGARFRPDFTGPIWMRQLLPCGYTMTIEYARFDSKEFDDDALKAVIDAANLLKSPVREIEMTGTSVTTDAIRDLQSRMPSCQVTYLQ